MKYDRSSARSKYAEASLGREGCSGMSFTGWVDDAVVYRSRDE